MGDSGIDNVASDGQNAPKRERVRLSKLSKAVDVSGVSEKGRLQRDSLLPIVRSFTISNICVFILIFVLSVFDHFAPSNGKIVVNDKVIISVIGGITVQVSAVILAAFKGLFRS